MTNERTDRDAELVADIVAKHMTNKCGNTMIVAQGKRCMDSPNNIADEILNVLTVETEGEARDRTALDAIAASLRDTDRADVTGYVNAADRVREVERFVIASGRSTTIETLDQPRTES